MTIHRSSTIRFLLAGALAVSAASATQAQKGPGTVEEYAGTTANMTPGSGNSVSFQVLQWSTDADREKVLNITTAAEGAGKGIEATQTVGYAWTTGSSIGYALKYAQREALPGGGERIVLVTERPLGAWERPGPWKATKPAATELPFTVIELHLNAAGAGEGKMSFATPFAVDKAKKTLALTGYETAPVLLQGVKRKAKAYGTN